MYGKGILGKSKEENAALKKPFIEDRAFLQRRLLQGFNAASSLPNVDVTRIAVLGFGFGGLCALDLARSGVDLKGAICIHGHFEPPINCPIQSIKAKVLVLHGYNDPISPVSKLHSFQQEMDKAKVDWQAHLYGNTFHGFAIPTSNDPLSGIMYNPVAAASAWKESELFLKTIFS
jgi:dienelactone hydrolase